MRNAALSRIICSLCFIEKRWVSPQTFQEYFSEASSKKRQKIRMPSKIPDR